MPLIQAKCESCGGILSVDSSLKTAVCPFCGSTYVVQNANNYFNNSYRVEHMHADVVHISDESSAEGRLKAADALLRLCKYEKAESEYKKVTEMTPQYYRGWLGLIESHTKNYSKRIESVEELNRLEDFAQSVLVFAPNGEKERIIEPYNDYINSEISRNTSEINAHISTISGQLELLKETDVQIKEREKILNQQNDAIVEKTRKGNTYSYMARIKVFVAILVGLAFIVAGYINFAFSAKIIVVLGFVFLILGFVIPIFLIVAKIWASAKNRKLSSELDILRLDRSQSVQKLGELHKQIDAYFYGIDNEQKATNRIYGLKRLLIALRPNDESIKTEQNKQINALNNIYSEIELAKKNRSNPAYIDETREQVVSADYAVEDQLRIRNMTIRWIVSIALALWALLWFMTYLGSSGAYLVWQIISQITLFLLAALINPFLSDVLEKSNTFKFIFKRKVLLLGVLIGVWIVFSITIFFVNLKSSASSSKNVVPIDEITAKWQSDGIVDYSDIAVFEQAVNNKEDLVGKTVKFTVVDVKPDSILGYNLYAGEHLNFISDEGRGVHAGDEITIIVTGVKPVLADSYKISYVLLDRQSG